MTPYMQVYGIVFNKKGHILVCRESSNGSWQLPGGKPEPGETPEEALKRELMEEISVSPNRTLLLGAIKVEFLNNHNKATGDIFYQLRYVCSLDKLLPLMPDPASGNMWERAFVPQESVTDYVQWGEPGKVMFKDAIKTWKSQDKS